VDAAFAPEALGGTINEICLLPRAGILSRTITFLYARGRRLAMTLTITANGKTEATRRSLNDDRKDVIPVRNADYRGYRCAFYDSFGDKSVINLSASRFQPPRIAQ